MSVLILLKGRFLLDMALFLDDVKVCQSDPNESVQQYSATSRNGGFVPRYLSSNVKNQHDFRDGKSHFCALTACKSLQHIGQVPSRRRPFRCTGTPAGRPKS